MAYVGNDYETLIYYPFRWQETPEGLYFWSYIEERWSNTEEGICYWSHINDLWNIFKYKNKISK